MDVVVYTLARKFPRMIGKFPNGQPIPFGSLSFHQIGVLIAGLVLVFVALQGFDTPKLATAVVGVFTIVPGMVAARRIGFSMARIDSRLLWLIRPVIRRSPMSTGGRAAPTAPAGPVATAAARAPFEAE